MTYHVVAFHNGAGLYLLDGGGTVEAPAEGERPEGLRRFTAARAAQLAAAALNVQDQGAHIWYAREDRTDGQPAALLPGIDPAALLLQTDPQAEDMADELAEVLAETASEAAAAEAAEGQPE